ncbi:daunorubicin biosynthesis sensory transduction protein DnrJ [Enemella evansiae]|uniref:DegT/DnrJ/EryC1/StrS family aminotransferase n=1 Tax=Enemella evansiae TaxID=2016499 RepID=UPI000B960CFC|nr:DegT/DnrJ/EryC1/StrS family aminotransferase [Enemella evansiae]OYO15483.1 daunorubicin biosynthesis sensory transduction protein DnrJ [Enemella evansiae]
MVNTAEPTTNINVWSYLPEWDLERDDILDAVTTVFESGRLVLGRSVESFEKEFAHWTGRAQCVGVDNGTNALTLALLASGIGAGDEVITVSNTAAPTVVAITNTGATPVFVDVLERNYLIDTDLIAHAITPRTKAIVPVHLYGQCANMDALMHTAAQHNLTVVEDCAQSHGATQHGQAAGSFGTAAAYSFYPTKVLGAYGDGGAICADSPEVIADLRRMRYYGMLDRYYVDRLPAFNSRLDEVQAEILRRKLERLDSYIQRRNQVADRYQQALAPLADHGLVLPSTEPGNTHVYYVYVVRHPLRDRIMERMRDQGINLNISYPWPIHTMTGFAHLGYTQGDLPVTEKLANEVFSLPMYPHLSQSDQDRVIETLTTTITDLTGA